MQHFSETKKRRGPKVPSFFSQVMIDKTQIEQILTGLIAQTDIFPVEISVSASNRIKILIDRPEGLGISDCAKISRAVEAALDRETQDFELEVSSPGAESVFKVPGQYLKNIGKEVEVRLVDQGIIKGKLLDYRSDFIVINPTKTTKKNNQNPPDNLEIPMSNISQVKGVISFTFK